MGVTRSNLANIPPLMALATGRRYLVLVTNYHSKHFLTRASKQEKFTMEKMGFKLARRRFSFLLYPPFRIVGLGALVAAGHIAN